MYPFSVDNSPWLKWCYHRWGYAGGATDDWYSSLAIPYSYTWELPEGDSDGFHDFKLPPSNIARVGKHLVVGLLKMANYLSKKMALKKEDGEDRNVKHKIMKYLKSQRRSKLRNGGPDL